MTIPPQKMHWWYESVMDCMEQNPDKNLKWVAARFDKTPTWIYVLINSDVFKAKWAERRGILTNRIHEQLEDLACTTLGKLAHKIETTPNLGVTPIRETAEMALQALGFVSKQGAGAAPVQINFNSIDAKSLADAREAYKTIQNGQAVATQLTHNEEEESALALPAPS